MSSPTENLLRLLLASWVPSLRSPTDLCPLIPSTLCCNHLFAGLPSLLDWEHQEDRNLSVTIMIVSPVPSPALTLGNAQLIPEETNK